MIPTDPSPGPLDNFFMQALLDSRQREINKASGRRYTGARGEVGAAKHRAKRKVRNRMRIASRKANKR